MKTKQIMATKGINKILVPVDGSKNSMRGLNEAVCLAKISGSEITAYYVFHLPLAAGIKYTKKMKEDAQRKAKKAISSAMRKAKKEGIPFKYKTGSGNTGEEIIKVSNSQKFDLIVIGARGLSGVKEKFLGSVSNFVVHKSKVPVLVIK